jgi:hypothetical protein
MITYFYTFDYDDAVTTDPLPELVSGSLANNMQMNAWMFATADKYEIPHLKALALEKFKQHADVTNADQMLGTAWTVFNDISIPEGEQELYWATYHMWLLGGADLVRNIGVESMAAWFTMNPDFMSKIFVRVMGGMTDGTVKQYCAKCNRWEQCQRSEVMTKKFACSKCFCTEAKDIVHLPSMVTMEKYW